MTRKRTPIVLPVRDPIADVMTPITLPAETVSGLRVHRDRYGRGWVVSTRHGLAVYGAPTRGREIPSRAAARSIAKYLAPYMPEVVLNGTWNGNEWERHGHGAQDFRRILVRLNKANITG